MEIQTHDHQTGRTSVAEIPLAVRGGRRVSAQLAIGFVPQVVTPQIRAKRESKTIKILNALKAGGSGGVTNVKLNPISFRYGAYIHTLRKRGHRISTECLDSLSGLWKFTYLGENE